MRITPRRCGLRGFARHRIRARRHDYGRLRMAGRDFGIDVVTVVGAVAGDGRHRPIDPVEQGTDLGAVIDILVGQHRGDDPAGVGVRGEMQHSPGPAPLGAVLLDQPFTGAAELQPRAVHQQVHRRAPRLRSRHLQRRGSPAEGAVIRHREVEGSVRARAIAPWLRKAWVGYRVASHRGRTKMRCLECGSEAVTERPERTAQGYRRFRCRACGKQFNERSGTLLNRTQYPCDVIALVLLWRLRYKLSLRDLPEMFAMRGIVFSYEAVREWEAKLTPALAEDLRRRRRGKVGRSWYVDETYLKVHGRWCYLYRAIDRNGNLVDVLFSKHRDMAAAQAFFRSAKAGIGVTPDRGTTTGHDRYPRAVRTEQGKELAKDVRHRTSAYLNNRLEQDHRSIKGRYRPMRGFKCPRSAARFCRAYDELRNFLRPRSRHHQHVPADCRRLLYLRRTATVLAILQAA